MTAMKQWPETLTDPLKKIMKAVKKFRSLQKANSMIFPSPEAEPIRCAECGSEMAPHELKRQPEVQGSKFAGMCDECVRLKLGLR